MFFIAFSRRLAGQDEQRSPGSDGSCPLYTICCVLLLYVMRCYLITRSYHVNIIFEHDQHTTGLHDIVMNFVKHSCYHPLGN